MSFNEIAAYLRAKGCELSRCSIEEILKIESYFSVKLPSCYKDFLFLMGKNAGHFMRGSSAFYNEIYHLKEGSEELLNENGFRLLPGDTFVFWMHQGYQFAFFYLSDGENPPIYFYYEGKTINDFEHKEISFTDFLEKQIIMSGL